MPISNQKIIKSDYLNRDVFGLPDKPSRDGISANALKERFDASTKNIVEPKHNALIDALTALTGATEIGASVDGLPGDTVAMVLSTVKALLDTKEPTESADSKLSYKFDKSEAQQLIKGIEYTESTGTFTITRYDDSQITIDTLLEKVPLNVRLDGQTFVLTLQDGTEQSVSLAKFLTDYEFIDSTDILFNRGHNSQSHNPPSQYGESNITLTATIKNGCITLDKLSPTVMSKIAAYEETASTSATNANAYMLTTQGYKDAAAQSAIDANASAQAAATSESNAASYANEAKGYRDQARDSANAAANSANSAAGSAGAAAQQAQNALTRANNANTSAAAAEASATAASQSATNASSAATAASTSRTDAELFAQAAAASAGEAEASAAATQELLDNIGLTVVDGMLCAIYTGGTL